MITGSSPVYPTNSLIMDKKIDALIAPTMSKLVEFMNREGLKKEDIIQIFQDDKSNYIVTFYK